MRIFRTHEKYQNTVFKTSYKQIRIKTIKTQNATPSYTIAKLEEKRDKEKIIRQLLGKAQNTVTGTASKTDN